jgi:multiple antibiotic resistance protein
MTSLVKRAEFEATAFASISAAILVTMLVTYMVLRASRIVLARIGPQGIDAATRIVGFFVAAMGMGLIFHGGHRGAANQWLGNRAPAIRRGN